MKGNSYMRAQNRGNSVFAKMMTIVALMLTFIVTGAWAQQTYTVTFSADDYSQTISDATLPYNKTISCTDLNKWAESFSFVNVEKGDGKVSASIDGGSMTITVSGAFSGEAEVWCYIIDVGGSQILYVVKVTCVANAPAEPTATQFAVTLADDTDDATSWQGKAGEGEYQELPLEGVAAGTAVSVKYNGQRRVKSVKAVMKTKPAATVTTAPMAKTGVKAGEDVAIVNEGAAEGGTMMYMVNATQPASTDGFSATVPTAEGLTAGTYYVWYYVKADATHTDSEISATGIEVTIAAAAAVPVTVTWNSFPTGVTSFSQDGVTLTADYIGWGTIDAMDADGKFTTTLGDFTKIEITAGVFNMSGEGWTVSGNKATWTGNASTVTFRHSGTNIDDCAIEYLSSIVFTIQPN